MTDLIAFPFNIEHTGNVAVQDDRSDDYYSGELAILVMTHPGERELVPEFGCTDAAFYDFSSAEFIKNISTFGPPVTIKECYVQEFTEGRRVVQIDYESTSVFDDQEFTDDDEQQEYFEDEGLGDN